MKRLIIIAILLFANSLTAQSAHQKKEEGESTSTHLQEQIACENRLIEVSGYKEITKGAEYQIFLGVVASFGSNNIPHLYIGSDDGINARYIYGSKLTDGRGKILVSRGLIKLFQNVSRALEGLFAHEMAHLDVDSGEVSCDESLKGWRDPREEEAADALAVRKVGHEPLRVMFLKFQELLGGKNQEMKTRLRALEELDKEKN